MAETETAETTEPFAEGLVLAEVEQELNTVHAILQQLPNDNPTFGVKGENGCDSVFYRLAQEALNELLGHVETALAIISNSSKSGNPTGQAYVKQEPYNAEESQYNNGSDEYMNYDVDEDERSLKRKKKRKKAFYSDDWSDDHALKRGKKKKKLKKEIKEEDYMAEDFLDDTDSDIHTPEARENLKQLIRWICTLPKDHQFSSGFDVLQRKQPSYYGLTAAKLCKFTIFILACLL